MNENNVTSFFNENNGKTFKDKNGQSIKLNLTSLDSFKQKMSTKVKRLDTFNKMWNVLGLNLFGKYNDFEKKYGTPTSTVGNGENIKKLISIDDRIKETTDPNQAIRYHQTPRGVTRVKIFFNDGRYLSREGTVNNRNNEITGTWYFRGDDNYQVKYGDGGVTRVFDFKSGMAPQVADTPPTPTPTTQTATGINPILQKLMKIDERIKKTTSPDQVVRRLTKGLWILYSDGNFRLRFGGINNKNGEFTGRWKFIGETDYQINTDDGDEYLASRGTWKSAETKVVSGKTWNEVSFTLDDILNGKSVLKIGDKGPVVAEVQKIMIELNLGQISKSGEPDGKFGKRTNLSVRQFQGNNMSKGEMDGKVGKDTLKRMIELRDYDGSEPQTDTGQPEMPTGGENPDVAKLNTTQSSQPAPVPQAAPTQPETPIQTKKKPNITPDALNEGDVKKIVSENLKSLLK